MFGLANKFKFNSFLFLDKKAEGEETPETSIKRSNNMKKKPIENVKDRIRAKSEKYVNKVETCLGRTKKKDEVK